MKKKSRVLFASEKLKNDFEILKEDDSIKKAIKRAIADLREDAFFGIQIPKKLFPKKFIQKYDIRNLWKYDLPKSWRLLYTVNPENEVEIVTIILCWSDHKNYENLMKY